MLKTMIRLKKVDQRLRKTTYPTCPYEKKVVKSNEQIAITERYSNDIWREMHDKGFKPMIDNDNPKFVSFFDQLALNAKLISRLTKRVDNACKKVNKNEHDIMYCHSRLNSSKFSTSF